MSELRREVTALRALAVYKVEDEFQLRPTGLFLATHVRPEAELPVFELADESNSQDRASTDATNAIALYQSLCTLEPSMASDRRLWTYLTHDPFFQYTRWRFPFSTSNDGVNNILDHWFVGRGGLRRNAVSRLWWAARLTHAPWRHSPELARFEKDDEFHYTRILLKNQDIYQGLVERDFGNSLLVRVAALDVLEQMEPAASNLTSLATRFLKGLNLVATHTDMGAAGIDALYDAMWELGERIVG